MLARAPDKERRGTFASFSRSSSFDPEWWLPSRMEDNPMVWMLEVNGFMMDIRTCPREVQEIAFQKGLIPYIPADRDVEEQTMPKKSRASNRFSGPLAYHMDGAVGSRVC